MSRQRDVATWNADQLRLYAALEGVDLVRLRAERPVESRTLPTVASGPPPVRPAAPSPSNGVAVAPRARSWTP